MIIGLSSSRAHVLSQEFVQGEVKKEYIARCSGEFPAEEVVVDQPLLTVDRQMGLNIVHPEGKVRVHRNSTHPSNRYPCEASKNYIHSFALRQKYEHERTALYVVVFRLLDSRVMVGITCRSPSDGSLYVCLPYHDLRVRLIIL
jgi:hypothetical protein